MKNTSRLYRSTQLGIPYQKSPQQRERESANATNSEAESSTPNPNPNSTTKKEGDQAGNESAAGASAPDMRSCTSSARGRADEGIKAMQGTCVKAGDEKTVTGEKSGKEGMRGDRFWEMMQYLT